MLRQTSSHTAAHTALHDDRLALNRDANLLQALNHDLGIVDGAHIQEQHVILPCHDGILDSALTTDTINGRVIWRATFRPFHAIHGTIPP